MDIDRSVDVLCYEFGQTIPFEPMMKMAGFLLRLKGENDQTNINATDQDKPGQGASLNL
jgi:hypothetical protein